LSEETIINQFAQFQSIITLSIDNTIYVYDELSDEIIHSIKDVNQQNNRHHILAMSNL